MTNRVTVELPEEFVISLGKDAPRELLTAAVLRWFEEGRLSQGQAAAMLAISRGDFFDLLHKHRISPIQMSLEELDQDFTRA
jgi:predicted HTH domain antitoxin